MKSAEFSRETYYFGCGYIKIKDLPEIESFLSLVLRKVIKILQEVPAEIRDRHYPSLLRYDETRVFHVVEDCVTDIVRSVLKRSKEWGQNGELTDTMVQTVKAICYHKAYLDRLICASSVADAIEYAESHELYEMKSENRFRRFWNKFSFFGLSQR